MGIFLLSCAAPFPAEPSGLPEPAGSTEPAVFVPEQPTLSTRRLRAGMTGYMLTVLKGTKPTRLPVEIVSVVPQKGSVKNSVMIRILPSGKNTIALAQGMSGSPVYVEGRLVGAVSVGWNFSDHRTALVTPIEDMYEVFSRPDKVIGVKNIDLKPTESADKSSSHARSLALPLMVGGVSDRALAGLKTALNLPAETVAVETVAQGTSGELPLSDVRFFPGEAAAVLLAWGDVEMAAVGTVTATSKDGRFLAFGHPFLERGAVNFPAAHARVHETVFSQVFPFKIASPTALAGTVTQDRSAGVGGRMGYFTPTIAATFAFRDMNLSGNARVVKNFRVVPDAFLGAKLLTGIYEGLLDDQWGRKGQGTATVTLRVEGRGLTKGWTRTNTFFSDADLGSLAVKESALIMEMLLLQPFKEIFPIGFRLDVSVTQEPQILYIEDVVVSSDAAPGDTLPVEVTLRPWRRNPVKKRFQVVVPKDATGSCELIVRGGGTNSLSQLAVEGGWKSIDSFDRMLKEIDAADANNQLIIELLHDQTGKTDEKTDKDGKKSTAELLPEEKEFLSETKARRIEEGTLRISRSDYVVEGLMKRLIDLNAKPEAKSQEKSKEKSKEKPKGKSSEKSNEKPKGKGGGK
ncbi:MAG: hypothetical protein LBP21_02500 [Synergistaceae bacterium]|jgi:hypothetical protein|nr:hypothetical protein [Synergistaceae bacterium]